MKLRKLASAFLIVGLLAGCGASTSCATLKPPATIVTVPGHIAWYGDRVLVAIQAIGELTKSGEAAGVIKREDAAKIGVAIKVSGEAAKDLASALEAGQSAMSNRDKAIAAIRAVLTNLPDQLSPGTGNLIRPYIATVLALLTAFSAS